jgi:hypothetical protein
MHLKGLMFLILLFLSFNSHGQNTQKDSACIKCEEHLKKIISQWNNVVANSNEVKLVDFKKKLEFKNSSDLKSLTILNNDTTYIGYGIHDNNLIKVRLVRRKEAYAKEFVESGTQVQFASKESMQNANEQAINASGYYYELLFLYNNEHIVLPALCSKSGVVINHLLLSREFLELKNQ